MKPVIFNNLRSEITKALDERIKLLLPLEKDGFILLDGFVNIPLQNEINGSFNIGGPSVPGVAVVGKTTGIIHTFALKILLPSVEI